MSEGDLWRTSEHSGEYRPLKKYDYYNNDYYSYDDYYDENAYEILEYHFLKFFGNESGVYQNSNINTKYE